MFEMQIFKHKTSYTQTKKNVQRLPTKLVVLQRERSVTSCAHNSRHGDLPDREVTVLLLVLLRLLDVQRCIFAGRRNQLVQHKQTHHSQQMIGNWRARRKKGQTKEKLLTINLLEPLKLSKNAFRAVLSFSLASLLDFFPLPFPFFPFFPFPFLLELCFSCVSSFTFTSFSTSLFFPLCLFFPSSTVESALQQDRTKKKKTFDVGSRTKKSSSSSGVRGWGGLMCQMGTQNLSKRSVKSIKHLHSTHLRNLQ